MADSTTNLDLLSSGQAQKEITANALYDALSKALIFGRRASTTTALTWGYYGGKLGGVATRIANGTVALTASATNYIEADKSTGAVSVNTTGFNTSTKYSLYKVVTGTSTVTSYEDWRDENFGSVAVATTSQAGIVKPDGTTITVAADGTITAATGGSITVKDEGTTLSTAVTSIDFVGAGVTATNTGGAVTVTIPGGGGGASTDYRNFTDRFYISYKAVFNIKNLIKPEISGAWTGASGGENAQAQDINMGKWGTFGRAKFQTSATANNVTYLYNGYHGFQRYVNSYFALHCTFGFSLSNFDCTNASFLFSLSPSAGSDLATTSNDFSYAGLLPSVGFRATDSNICIFYRDASNVLTVVDLGVNFPVPRATTDKYAYEAIIKKIDTSTNFTVIVNRINTGDGVTFTSINVVNSLPFATTASNTYYAQAQLKTTVAVAKQIYIRNIDCWNWVE